MDAPPPTEDVAELLAQVAHELRTPLTPIKGLLHTLKRRDADLTPAERGEVYEILLREEQRLEDLVSTLLDATAPGWPPPPTLELLDWPTLVAAQVDLYRGNDPTRTIAVADRSEGSPVVADRTLSTGVLANLVTNALVHSPEGSPIEVTTARDGGRVVTTVADHGPGVPPADRDRIFERFVRVGDRRTTTKGVGLGLFLARRSVERMGGEIWCEETPGGGAQLGFSLPIADVSSR